MVIYSPRSYACRKAAELQRGPCCRRGSSSRYLSKNPGPQEKKTIMPKLWWNARVNAPVLSLAGTDAARPTPPDIVIEGRIDLSQWHILASRCSPTNTAFNLPFSSQLKIQISVRQGLIPAIAVQQLGRCEDIRPRASVSNNTPWSPPPRPPPPETSCHFQTRHGGLSTPLASHWTLHWNTPARQRPP